MFDIFGLYCKSAHRNEELEQTIEEQQETIHELQTLLKFRTNENKSLYKEINRLKELIKIKDNDRIELVKENTTLKNDYKKCYDENVRLAKENNQLKFRNKMLTKIGFNSIYGTHCYKNYCVNSVYGSYCCKKHWTYTDTDSIKTESEDTKQ